MAQHGRERSQEVYFILGEGPCIVDRAQGDHKLALYLSEPLVLLVPSDIGNHNFALGRPVKTLSKDLKGKGVPPYKLLVDFLW